LSISSNSFLLFLDNRRLRSSTSSSTGKAYQYGCQLQPLVAIIGPTLEEIHQYFVVLGIRKYFEVNSALKTIDVRFKIFHALQTQYPPECA